MAMRCGAAPVGAHVAADGAHVRQQVDGVSDEAGLLGVHLAADVQDIRQMWRRRHDAPRMLDRRHHLPQPLVSVSQT